MWMLRVALLIIVKNWKKKTKQTKHGTVTQWNTAQ